MTSAGSAAAAPWGSGRVDPFVRLRGWCTLACLGLLFVSAAPAVAVPSNVRISGLTDLAFNTITDLSSDTSLEEDVCVYSNSATNGYRVTATGSGTGSAFQLVSGGNKLAYEVQWKAQAGQSSGTQLSAGSPLTGLVSSATQQSCNSGPSASASLIVVLRAAALSSALPGTYSGQLTLLIAPE